jgi:hypothetical protein
MGRDSKEHELNRLYDAFCKCAINKKTMKVKTCVGNFEFIPVSYSTSAVYVEVHEPTHAPEKIKPFWSLWNVLRALWATLRHRKRHAKAMA